MSNSSVANVVRELVPLLFVEELSHSLRFYRDQLGFQLTDAWKPGERLEWCLLRRGGSAVMLQQATVEDQPATGRGHGVGFYFFCDDVDTEYSQWLGAGLSPAPPEVAFYGMKQLFITDPDGYNICFQQPVAQG